MKRFTQEPSPSSQPSPARPQLPPTSPTSNLAASLLSPSGAAGHRQIRSSPKARSRRRGGAQASSRRHGATVAAARRSRKRGGFVVEAQRGGTNPDLIGWVRMASLEKVLGSSPVLLI